MMPPLDFNEVPLFSGVNPDGMKLLLERAQHSTVPAGTVIVKEGELGNKLYVVESGNVRVCKNLGLSNEVELAKMGRCDFFGEMCILETLPRAASVVALTEATLYAIPSRAFADLFDQQARQHGILVLNLARDLSRRLRNLGKMFAASMENRYVIDISKA